MKDLKDLIKAIVDSKELLELIYRDIAQPGTRQVGKAIGTILGLGNTLLLPIRMLNEKASITFRMNMERYREAIRDIPEIEIQVISPEIGIPVLDRLTYVQDELLSEMFIALLARASNKSSADEAHPAFIAIIDSLCPDEALLVRALRPMVINRYGEYAHQLSGATTPRPGYENLVFDKVSFLLDPKILKEAKLQFPEYVSPYIQNLKRLGLIETGKFMPIETDDAICTRIKNHHAINPESSPFAQLSHASALWEFGEIRYTDFGRFFRHICLTGARSMESDSIRAERGRRD